MKNTNILHRVLTGCAVVAIMYLFISEASFVLRPVPIVFNDTQVAYGYSSEFSSGGSGGSSDGSGDSSDGSSNSSGGSGGSSDGSGDSSDGSGNSSGGSGGSSDSSGDSSDGTVTFTGTVYHDEGSDAVSAGSGVKIDINGVFASGAYTDSSGGYSIVDLTVSALDVITFFIDNEDGKGVLIMKVSSDEISDNSVTGMDIYKDHLILRESTDAEVNLTTSDLLVADDSGDADIASIYTLSSNELRLARNTELFVHSDATFTMSGTIYTHDLDVRGTLKAGSQDIVASGSVSAGGSLTTSASLTLTSVESGETLHVPGDTLYNLYIDNGLEAYFRMDEGTGLNASGSSLNAGTGGSLTSGPSWVQTNTGTTSFYNPYAIEFDGTDDVVSFNDAWELTLNNTQRSFATWFRRKSSTTEDVIFAKKTSSGTSNVGYMLYIDDETDMLNFEVADASSNRFVVVSDSSVTDQNWHHVSVSFDSDDNDRTNIFLDGSIDVGSKSGSFSSTIGNTVDFTIGSDNGIKGPFEGTIDDFRIYNRVLSGSEVSVLNAGNKSTGSGTYLLNSAIDVENDFGIYAGTLDVGTGYAINVAGDMNIYGELRTNSGTVTLDGTTQTLRGSTAFREISKSVTTSTTLTFESNTEQTVSGAITLKGETNQRLKLRASVTGSQAYLIVEDSGATVLKHLDVKDNNAFSGALMSCTSGCVDSENNINWDFQGECGDGVVNTGEECDDGNSVNTDSCPNDCINAVCGDSVIEGSEDCDPPNTGQCQSNCQFRGAGGGGGGGFSSAASTASYYKRPEPPDGCGNGFLDLDKGEECDAGTRYNGLGTCSYGCKKLTCGDGVISPQNGEDCEPTVAGTRNGFTIFDVATCGETCTAPTVTPEGTLWGGCRRTFLQACGAASSSSSGAPRTSRCGNGVVDSGEECDFGGICEGGQFDGSLWTDKTSVTTCEGGGGVATPKGNDGCSETCKTEFCGDGSIQQRGADNQPNTADDEDCDNGSVCSDDANMSCRLDSDCIGENTCEYHSAKTSSCSNTCKNSTSASRPKPSAPVKSTVECGNGNTEAGEECDLGSQNGKATSTCTSTCTNRVVDRPAGSTEPLCGNAILDTDEECDNGDQNSDTQASACRTNCTDPICGDFVVDSGEQCDNGEGNSDFFPDSCRLSCRLPYCGDGVRDSNEECDGGLSCLHNCTRAMKNAKCGNGMREAGEQCDDGNTVSGDGCSAFCQNEETIVASVSTCGNGSIEAGEQCDDANEDDNDTCSSSCTITEGVTRKAATTGLQIDANVIIVNPTEIANAIKFITGNDPCSTLVMKGQNQKASLIREAGRLQNIPIIENIPLAREIFSSIRPGETIYGDLCKEINIVKAKVSEKKALPSIEPTPQPLPQAPTQYAYGYYPYAQVTPLVVQQPPAGDTGPAMVGIAISGIAGGMGWVRRRRKKAL